MLPVSAGPGRLAAAAAAAAGRSSQVYVAAGGSAGPETAAANLKLIFPASPRQVMSLLPVRVWGQYPSTGIWQGSSEGRWPSQPAPDPSGGIACCGEAHGPGARARARARRARIRVVCPRRGPYPDARSSHGRPRRLGLVRACHGASGGGAVHDGPGLPIGSQGRGPIGPEADGPLPPAPDARARARTHTHVDLVSTPDSSCLSRQPSRPALAQCMPAKRHGRDMPRCPPKAQNLNPQAPSPRVANLGCAQCPRLGVGNQPF